MAGESLCIIAVDKSSSGKVDGGLGVSVNLLKKENL